MQHSAAGHSASLPKLLPFTQGLRLVRTKQASLKEIQVNLSVTGDGELTDLQMLPICRHFGNALQPRKRPPALGPLFASRSTRGLPHRGQVRHSVGGVVGVGTARGGGGGTGGGTAGGALAGDEAMTSR